MNFNLVTQSCKLIRIFLCYDRIVRFEIVVKHGFCGLHELLSEVVVMVLVDEFVN